MRADSNEPGGIPVAIRPPDIRLQACDPRAHAGLLRDWLHRPHVAQWWGDPQATWEGVLAWPAANCALIHAEGTPIGFTCWQTPPEAELKAAGLAGLPRGLMDIDILIGEPDFLGRGLGPRALELLLARLRADPLTLLAGLGTAAANARAVRAFTKAGFHTFREFQDPRFGRCLYMVAELGHAA